MTEPISRRLAARSLALGLVAATAAVAADQPQPEKKPDPIEQEIDARMAWILARYGDRLDEAARKSVRGEVAAVVRRGRALKARPLDQGVGPDPPFVPYRDSKSGGPPDAPR